METLGQRIKRHREDRQLSQQQLADAADVSRVAVTKWESGQTANLKLGNLLCICKLFNVRVDEMIQGEHATKTIISQMAPDSADLSSDILVRYSMADSATKALVDLALLGKDQIPEWVTKPIKRHLGTLLEDIGEAIPGTEKHNKAA